MVDKLEDVLKIVDLSVPVQEIDVPKISSLSCPPPRRVLPEPQSADQLVEVPTVLSPLRIAEQIVGIPVVQGRGKRRLQGFLPEEGSTVTPSSLERISEQIVEQIVCRAGECAGGWARQLIHAERSSNGSWRSARKLRQFHRVG